MIVGPGMTVAIGYDPKQTSPEEIMRAIYSLVGVKTAVEVTREPEL